MMRLDRFVAETTELTRSAAAKAIRDGTVLVNGLPVRRPEQKIDEQRDGVQVGGKRCSYSRFHTYMLDKPTGVITAARDPKQKTVLDLFPAEIRKQVGIVDELIRLSVGIEDVDDLIEDLRRAIENSVKK